MTRNKSALEKHIFPIFGKRLYTTIKPIEWMNHLKGMMCAEKTGGFNLVNYRHSSGVYHEQETEDLHRRI